MQTELQNFSEKEYVLLNEMKIQNVATMVCQINIEEVDHENQESS